MILFAVLLSILLAAFIARRAFRIGQHPLDKETGRRRARQPLKKSSKVYEMFGVSSSEEYYINSRGVELFCKQWVPLGRVPRAVLFYCHGYGDTCTWTFEDVAIKLASEGFAVVSMDYEGHGMSAGLHGYIPRFSNLVDDVIELSSALRVRPDFMGLPFFLYGESMGGAVAIQVHRRQPHLWTGALLVAPMCKIAEEMMPPPAVVSVLRVLAKVVPTWKLVPTKDITEVGFRDVEKRERVRNNPVGYVGKPRLLTALQLLLATEEIGENLHQISIPLLVLHGAEDVVTSPESSRALVTHCASSDKALRLYEGAWHGLTCAEPDEVESLVLSDMISWLRNRCPPVGIQPVGLGGLGFKGGYGFQGGEMSQEAGVWQPMLRKVDSFDEDAQSAVTAL